MTCAEFRRWLDDGRPEKERSRMTGHAEGCVRCEEEHAAAVEIERWLAVAVPVAVSPGFHDLVVRRIRARDRSGWRRAIGAFGQIMAEPLVPLSIAVAVMVGWYHAKLTDQLTEGFERALRGIDRLPLFGQLTIVHALVAAAIVLCVSWQVFRTVQRVV